VIDDTPIGLDVTGWHQEVGYDKEGGDLRAFRCSARIRENQHLALIGGPDISTLRFDLALRRGECQPKEPPERGIGILTFSEPVEHIDAMVYGWWRMPESLYDEVWLQVREHTWRYCTVQLSIGPVEYEIDDRHWDVTKNKTLYITNASVSFARFWPEDEDFWKINVLGFQFNVRRSKKTP
jgi:hypothetical protein